MIRQPPRNKDDNSVIPHDHEEIKDEDEVIRRISNELIVLDANGNKRISSMAYRASSGKNGGMSVDLKELIENDGISPREYVTTPRWMGSVLFKVCDLRKLEFKVGYDPIESKNPYHGQVWGNFSRSKRRKLMGLAKWFVPIEGASLI